MGIVLSSLTFLIQTLMTLDCVHLSMRISRIYICLFLRLCLRDIFINLCLLSSQNNIATTHSAGGISFLLLAPSSHWQSRKFIVEFEDGVKLFAKSVEKKLHNKLRRTSVYSLNLIVHDSKAWCPINSWKTIETANISWLIFQYLMENKKLIFINRQQLLAR